MAKPIGALAQNFSSFGKGGNSIGEKLRGKVNVKIKFGRAKLKGE